MANLLRICIEDKDGAKLYIPNSAGQTFTIKTTWESSTISLSTLATGLATISLEGYQDEFSVPPAYCVGFIRGLLITGKNKNDHIIVTTLIGSMGFNLSGEAGWKEIDSFNFYIYTDITNLNIALTFDVVPM